MSPPDDLDRFSPAELKGLVVEQWEQIVELQRMVAALRDEIARLKGGPGRPKIKPSGERALAAHVIARLVEHPDRHFCDRNAWNAHLDARGITALKVNPNPVLIATEGALW